MNLLTLNSLSSKTVEELIDVSLEIKKNPDQDLESILEDFPKQNFLNREKAQKYFNLMIEKMHAAKAGPFTHLMPINKYNGKVYMAIGMGFVHYIIWSENYLLWLQTDQPFGTTLPPRLLALYPA